MKNLKKIKRNELKSVSGGASKCYDLRDSPVDPCEELNNLGTGCYRFNNCIMACTLGLCL